MIASVKEALSNLIDCFKGDFSSLGTHSDNGFTLTNRFPPCRIKYFLSIRCCTLTLKALQSSVECPADPTWYPHCSLGLLLRWEWLRWRLQWLGTTSELWIRYGRIWLYVRGIGSRGAILYSILFWDCADFDTLSLGLLILRNLSLMRLMIFIWCLVWRLLILSRISKFHPWIESLSRLDPKMKIRSTEYPMMNMLRCNISISFPRVGRRHSRVWRMKTLIGVLHRRLSN